MSRRHVVRRPKVLVVDDEPDLLSAWSDLLTLEGFQVETASNGANALDRLESLEPPDALVLDLLMPQMSGHDVLESAGSLLDAVFVIVLSGELIDISSSARANVWLTKPVSADALLAALQEGLRSGRPKLPGPTVRSTGGPRLTRF